MGVVLHRLTATQRANADAGTDCGSSKSQTMVRRMGTITLDDPIDAFIKRWSASSGAERANFQSFANELCTLLGVPLPDPAHEEMTRNDYTFERSVRFKDATGTTSPGRIDLYKRNSFVMEAKQSREKGRPKALPGQADLLTPDYNPRGEPSANRAWDTLMLNARRQAEEYARALEADHDWPPFVIVCDVGHCIELYADFSGRGRDYRLFPDSLNYRVYLSDLRKPDVRKRLAAIWTDPKSLDPAKQSAKVTRDVAADLAKVSKALEKRLVEPLPAEQRAAMTEAIAMFLMRCLFTMFAEDVKLLPEGCFTRWLQGAIANPAKFRHELAQLWQAMDKGAEYTTITEGKVRRFNGHFFTSSTVFDLEPDEITALRDASKRNWKLVEPAIFGTLLEQALDKTERGQLGAHYTPKPYVERLVLVTIMEPLRQEWAQVQATIERLKGEGRDKDALQCARDFHHKLCTTRVLDPACGTGNFLYLSLALMKELEGEVLQAVLSLGGTEGFSLMQGEQVGPRQFLGIEKNSRAAAIAELVIWIGYLQWHFATRSDMPTDPILEDIHNIQHIDAVLTWDGYPVPAVITDVQGNRRESFTNARRPDWPEAEFIIGNPPFIGGSMVRSNLGDNYAEALWAAHSNRVNDSADFVMFWWDRAAEILTAKKSKLQRFGFVTTNSITQVFSRRVVARHLEAKSPLSIIMAIPDHPWTKATDDHASVRIAMTVAMAGNHEGVLREVIAEAALNTDQPVIETRDNTGHINSDLTLGADVTATLELTATAGLCSPGVKLHGAGFIVTPAQAEALGLGSTPGLEHQIRHYRNGKDLTGKPRGKMVIDLFGFEAEEVLKRFPHVYQHIVEEVQNKTKIDAKTRELKYIGRKWNNRASYRDNWWIFGEPRSDLRPALANLSRYIVTVETTKHRVFQFLDATILPDNMLICVGSDDGFHLGILSSRVHLVWTSRAGGTLEDRPRYSKSRCFDRFPFPICSAEAEVRLRAVANDLDAHRKARQAENPRLTLTQMYNVLEKMRAEAVLSTVDERIKKQGLVTILRQYHDKIDALSLEAYGWTDNPTDEEILDRLVALNAARAAEEKAGTIRWLRPDYQIPKFGTEAEQARLKAERAAAKAAQLDLDGEDDDEDAATKPKFPTGKELDETISIVSTLANSPAPMSVLAIASTFAQGKALEKRVTLTIQALARLGHVATADGGNTYALRRTG